MGERAARNPEPSLLRSLMSEHLDLGYAAAAANRRAEPPSVVDRLILCLGAVLLGWVLGVAVAHAAGSEADFSGEQSDALAGVRDAERLSAELDRERQSLTDQVDSARSSALLSDAEGSVVLESLRRVEFAAGVQPVSGTGIVVTVAEPPARTDLSDASMPRRSSSEAVVLDRDLQVLVNSLWVSGAEAIAVDDVRIGPGVTIRQAGGAMLVDNRPVFSPYTVSAIGSPDILQTRFSVSDAYLRLSAIAQLYKVSFQLQSSDALDMPAAPTRAIDAATQGGDR
ncbi:DUF881 domain-containing protein [Rhodococcus sp. G-MC3]|uniref:DUF881 domain-containing protein n=1 Tax=Rhodococcus sp. G-MC3 TaxID=3046209 RepID=UPI0024BB119B|nr:DUF881 domain-containing protein [Rhodococcus sp. G-MC3]MDJ0394130.1 DUF881 domain-containing protein [Rhodococcus sp. G-MC3]